MTADDAAGAAEGKAADVGISEAYGLGFGEPIAMSAEHGEGLGDLFQALIRVAPEKSKPPEDLNPFGDEEELVLDTFECYNTETKTWANLPSMKRLVQGPNTLISDTTTSETNSNQSILH